MEPMGCWLTIGITESMVNRLVMGVWKLNIMPGSSQTKKSVRERKNPEFMRGRERKNRRREDVTPYHSDHGAGRSKDGLGQDVPATMKKVRLMSAGLSEKGPSLGH